MAPPTSSPSLLVCFWSKKDHRESFIPFGLHLVVLFCEILKQAKIKTSIGLCFDATRCLVSNKLEFAQFGAHLQKLWQFWFYCYPLLSSLQNEGLLVLLIWGMR